MQKEHIPKIKQARIAAGLTQAAMSELLGMSKRAIESWETATRKCPPWAEKLIIEKLENIKNNQ